MITARLRSRWLAVTPTVRTVVTVFVAARLLTFLVAWVVTGVRSGTGFTEVLTDWDGN